MSEQKNEQLSFSFTENKMIIVPMAYSSDGDTFEQPHLIDEISEKTKGDEKWKK